jgi:hypothetical protein
LGRSWFEVSLGKTLVESHLKNEPDVVRHSCNPSYQRGVVRSITVWGSLRQKPDHFWKIPKVKRAGGMTQVIEHLSSKHKIPYPNPRIYLKSASGHTLEEIKTKFLYLLNFLPSSQGDAFTYQCSTEQVYDWTTVSTVKLRTSVSVGDMKEWPGTLEGKWKLCLCCLSLLFLVISLKVLYKTIANNFETSW